jgi:hypothetical protein
MKVNKNLSAEQADIPPEQPPDNIPDVEHSEIPPSSGKITSW